MFNDVYDTVMPHLEEQRASLKDHLKKHGDKYDLNLYKDGPTYASN